MKLKIFIFSVIFISISSCKKEAGVDNASNLTNGNSSNTIMSLGASRVEGNRPDYESFRYELWQDLLNNGWNFDFIGTQSDPATYPTINNNVFDPDHEGRGGWTSGDILNDISDWLNQTGPVDVVLFSSPGGNDALQGLPYNQAIININGIIDAIQVSNPNVTIIIEQMAPGHSSIMTQDLTTFLNQLHQDIPSIASTQSTPSSQVIAVDMYTGFSDSMLADDVHYNQVGADFIATRYYNELISVLEN